MLGAGRVGGPKLLLTGLGDIMKKREHLTIVIVWVGLLVVAVFLFRGRLFGERDAATVR